VIAGTNFDRATNLHLHPTDFAYEWLYHIPSSNAIIKFYCLLTEALNSLLKVVT